MGVVLNSVHLCTIDCAHISWCAFRAIYSIVNAFQFYYFHFCYKLVYVRMYVRTYEPRIWDLADILIANYLWLIQADSDNQSNI